MRGYELCLIFHPEVTEEDIANILETMGKSISKLKGSILKTEKWGKKSLKYTIKKQSKGYYCFLYYIGNNEILREIERIVKFNESVLRYNTIRLEKNFKVEHTEKSLQTAETKSMTEKPEEIEKNTSNEFNETVENGSAEEIINNSNTNE